MFKKDKVVGGGRWRVTQKQTDWEAIFGTIFVIGILLLLLSSCGG